MLFISRILIRKVYIAQNLYCIFCDGFCDGFREPFLIFSGGMPRASYSDRYTITTMHGESHVVFDFTSKVVDFVALCRADELGGSDADGGRYVLRKFDVNFTDSGFT